MVATSVCGTRTDEIVTLVNAVFTASERPGEGDQIGALHAICWWHRRVI